MDETRYDLTAHYAVEQQPADHGQTAHHQSGSSRRGLVALTIVIGLLSLVGGAVVGASIGGPDTESGPEHVAAPDTTTASTTDDLAHDGEPTTPETPPQDPGPDPVEDPTPTTEPEDPDDGEEGGVVVTKIPPGVFLPSIGFDEVIDMGPASSAQWTLTNTGIGNASWSITGGVGLSFGSPGNDWVVIPAGTLEPGESITITVGLAGSTGPGAWSKAFTLNHPGGQTAIDVIGNKPLQILPDP